MLFQCIHLSRERFFRHSHPLMIGIGVKYDSWYFTVNIKLVGFTGRPTDWERQSSEKLLFRLPSEPTALDKCSCWERLTTCFIQKLHYTNTSTGKSKGQNYIQAESRPLMPMASSQTFLCHQPDQAHIALLSLRPPESSCETVAPLNPTLLLVLRTSWRTEMMNVLHMLMLRELRVQEMAECGPNQGKFFYAPKKTIKL